MVTEVAIETLYPRSRALARKIRTALRMVRLDVGIALRGLYFNQIVGSFFVPQILRKYLYRAGGIRTDSFMLAPHCRIEGRAGNISIGGGTYMNVGCYLEAVGRIDIGKECAIGMQAMFVTSDHPRHANGSWDSQATGRSIVVGDRVWIGARASILPGVSIANDVIIAAGAVVTRDCPRAGLYAGVPARRIRHIEPAIADIGVKTITRSAR